MSNRLSSFGYWPPEAPDRFGGIITAQPQLSIPTQCGTQFIVRGSGTVSRIAAASVGPSVDLRISDSPKFTNSAWLLCPNGADYQSFPGDLIIVINEGSGTWRLFPLTTPPDGILSKSIQINGGMEVSQEWTTTLKTLTNNTAKYITDGWQSIYNHGAATAVVSSGQIAPSGFILPLNGFSAALQMFATTAISSPANGDFAIHRQPIEGTRLAPLAWGTSGAQPLTIGFWVFATGGTSWARIVNAALARSYYFEFPVVAGWNWVTRVIPGDTSGTWLQTTAVAAYFDVAGAGKSAATATVDAWGTSIASTALQTPNSTNLLGTNNNLFVLTGVMLLPGAWNIPSTRSSLFLKTFADALRECQRYYTKTFPSTVAPADNGGLAGAIIGKGIDAGNREPVACWMLPTPMRANPSVTLYTPGTGTAAQWGNPNAQTANARAGGGGASDAIVQIDNTGTSFSNVVQLYIHATANARM